jgi:phosphoribosylamine---glycine ligase
MKVCLIGGGGREHALAWKISQSPLCDKLYLAPGNPLSAEFGQRVSLSADDITALKYFVKKEGIDLTIVGPEAPLVAGIVDSFEADGLKIFGPSKAASQLEGSKEFSKDFMKKFNIPTAAYQIAESMDEALIVLERLGVPIVVKANGLAEGKGAFVCHTEDEVKKALHAIFAEKRFGASGMSCVMEEFMHGEEASLFVITDGNTIIPMLAAQDHKAVYDNDEGPNTGGMGAYAPAPLVTPKILDKILKDIVVPTIHGMNSEGTPYRGLLYVGLMIKDGNSKVVEFNCRFGDPETQPLMTLLNSDLLELMWKVANHHIDEEYNGLEWHEGSAIGVVLASGGYPGKYEKNKVITGIETLENVQAFAAGVSGDLASLRTSGGRVLCLTARGKDLEEAREVLYSQINRVQFEGCFYRTDIGAKALSKAK